MADRCRAKGKDMLCPDSLKEMHNMIQDWPIEKTYDSDGAIYADGTPIPDQNKPIQLYEKEFREIFFGE